MSSPTAVSAYVESVLDVLPDGIFITNTAGKTLYVNRMYEQITGLHKESVLGRDVRIMVEEGVFDRALNPEVVKTGKPCTHVQQLGNGKKLVLSGLPVFDESGTLRLVVTLARDITMITHLHEQLDDQRKLINQIHEQLAYISQQGARTHETIFESQAMLGVKNYLQDVAATDATVLILGETGVGKDVFARYTHSMSARRDKILLKVDCGGISESLTESEMFGYMPGAFTGASNKGKPGYFELANGGTVFLDEIGELPLSMQTRLLRVLQDGEIMRVGGSHPQKVDVRIIAATNRNLEECVREGTFRSDLYYRLNVASVSIPPLRDRPQDIKPLAEYFLAQFCAKYHKSMAFMEVTQDVLARYKWPGNVRELQNMVHSLVITHHGSLISPHDLPAHIAGGSSEARVYSEEILSGGRPLKDIMAELEGSFLLQAIETHGSVQKVAEMFHINRSTVFRKIQRAHPAQKQGDVD